MLVIIILQDDYIQLYGRCKFRYSDKLMRITVLGSISDYSASESLVSLLLVSQKPTLEETLIDRWYLFFFHLLYSPSSRALSVYRNINKLILILNNVCSIGKLLNLHSGPNKNIP